MNNEDHVLGLWIGGGVTPAALDELDSAIHHWIEAREIAGNNLPAAVETELLNVANACCAQLSRLPKPDPTRYL